MLPESVSLLMAQFPFQFQPPDFWLPTLETILTVLYAVAIRGYLIFLLIGFVIYTTTYGDGFGKFFVGAGFFLYFAGPLLVNLFAQLATIELVSFETATLAWTNLVGMPDADIIYTIVWIGDLVGAICLLTGAILYFTKAAGDLESKGKSLIIRSLILFAILSYFHFAPFVI
ncbi:MAG: hypothetical protein IH631_03275 [Candidatus Thorarchaeota archaeon]|nr:hypothetical protein [Candidatus Thorarchaeota archaeon]TFH10375.1 MAG: hypothetical protein E4H14_02680 [Candidatus Thorarchaeota archaeon]